MRQIGGDSEGFASESCTTGGIAMNRRLGMFVVSALLMAPALPASAQQGAVKQAKQEAKEANREAKAAKKEAERADSDAEEARKGAKEANDDAREAREELRKTTKEQRERIREAQKTGDEGEIREARQEAREEIQEKRKALREQQREAREAKGGLSEQEREARRAEKMAARKQRAARRARADKKRTERWRSLSKRAEKPDAKPGDMPPPMRHELRVHEHRMAKLDRIEAIAEEKDNDKLVDRVKELRKKEKKQHEAKMDKLIESWKGKS